MPSLYCLSRYCTQETVSTQEQSANGLGRTTSPDCKDSWSFIFHRFLVCKMKKFIILNIYILASGKVNMYPHCKQECNREIHSLLHKLNYDSTCHAVRQEVHIRCPQGSIFTSLSFSAQILHSWKVEPISQYNSYCSCNKRKSSDYFFPMICSQRIYFSKCPVFQPALLINKGNSCYWPKSHTKITETAYVFASSNLWYTAIHAKKCLRYLCLLDFVQTCHM